MNYIIFIICSIILPIVSLKQAKFCVNCKHFIPDNTDEKFGKCSFFPRDNINFLVTGINHDEYFYCSVLRKNEEMCGKEGKHYKKKIVKKSHNEKNTENDSLNFF